MRAVALCLSLGLLLTLASCGDDGNAFEFKSIAADPVGEKILIRYEMTPGAGVRMTMNMRGSMQMSGDVNMTVPMNTSMAMALRCTDVRPDGDSVLEVAVVDVQFDAGQVTPPSGAADLLKDLRFTMTVSRDGRMTMDSIEGLDDEVLKPVKQMLNNPGFQYFIPMPEGGMRVGEALDLGEILSQEALEQLMSQALPGSGLKPSMQGEMVLTGTREVDGETAAEFAVNMVMNLQGEISKRGSSVEMDMGLRMTGTQLNSLATGFPIGSAEWNMEMRADVEGGDKELEMRMHATMSIRSERL